MASPLEETMAWEIYERQVIRTGEPTVTIGKMGRIAFNMVAAGILSDHKATHLILMWDKESFKCAAKIASSIDSGAYKVTYAEKSNGAGFSAVTFLNYIRYDWTETRSFNAVWDESTKMLIFSIPQKHFGASGKLRQELGRVKRPDRLKSEEVEPSKEKEATEVTS
jgi:hypothetical protein